MTGGGGRDRERAEAAPEELPELPVPEPAAVVGSATLAGLLGDRYPVVGRLGAGAFGEVYRAHDRLLGREVAIKRVRLEAFADPEQLEDVKQRFLREAQVEARLRHPNIVTTHDIVSSPQTSFIVMELVDGRTLQSLLDQRRRLPLDEAMAILRQVAAALDHAHAQQVVHRDVKPANVMVEPSGHVKVMDFGIAKLESGGNLTASGVIMGTPNYMSPEQARGEKVDARSDLFSLGCLLYECLTGTRPFHADSVGLILVKILTEDPPAIDFDATGLPRAMEAVLRRATAKDPGARFASGAEMMEAVRRAGEGRPLPAAGTVVASRGRTARAGAFRRRPLLVGIAALAVLSALGWLAADRLLPRRVRITVPAGTPLRLALETPLSSETAVTGAPAAASTTSPLQVEGLEAVPRGSRLVGHVLRAASAEQAGGRGELSLAFDTLELDGERVRLRTRPLEMRAPPPPRKRDRKKKENALLAGLSEIGDALGSVVVRVKTSGDGVKGGSAATVAVTSASGREITLPARASLSIELAEPLTLLRPKP